MIFTLALIQVEAKYGRHCSCYHRINEGQLLHVHVILHSQLMFMQQLAWSFIFIYS